jgi:protein-histidine pros-kinase
MKIRAKIDLAMLAAFVVGMGLAAVGAYTILKRNAIAESVQNGRIILEAASAIRSYTDKNIDPLLKEQLKVEFLPESIPFFAAKSEFAETHEEFRELCLS